jgi:hypothetical protein
MFENEEWREIEDFPHYSISNYGRVKHENRVEARKVTVNDRGFPIVTLFGKDKKTRYLRQINKLVAQAFLPTPMFHDETAVWHIDGDLSNCRVENLKWDTRSRVLEWNEMNRTLKPKLVTPKVKNNRTGKVYANAFECALDEGQLETTIVWKVERQARNMEDDNARYRYIYGN